MTAMIYVINGPNLNLLGQREPEIYGRTTLADIERLCVATAKEAGMAVEFRQSNHEGQLLDWLHEARIRAQGAIINAGGSSHTSVALHDAVRAMGKPVIEVHLSNIYAREEFRHHSMISAAAAGVICGLGAEGYRLAVLALAQLLTSSR